MSEETIVCCTTDDSHTVDLINVTIHKDPVWGWYLNVTYRVETPEAVNEVNIPKIRLNINPHSFRIERRFEELFGGSVGCWADIGFGEKELLCKDDYYFVERTVKFKTKEMTLDEIEKKLGHKVKIVNK